MKTLKSLLTLLALGVATSALLNAQDETKPANPPAEGRRGKAGQRGGAEGRGPGQLMNPEARVAQLDRALSLTADQKTKLTDIFTKQREEMQAMRGSGDPRANREKMQQEMQATRDQVQALLTDEQKKKFEAMEPPGRGGAKGGPRGGQGKRKKDA